MSADQLLRDRQTVLTTYRIARERGLAPLPAMQAVRNEIANDVAHACASGRVAHRTLFARQWRIADDYLTHIENVLPQLPYWQTGKMTFAPASMRSDVVRACVACGAEWDRYNAPSKCPTCRVLTGEMTRGELDAIYHAGVANAADVTA